MSDRLSGWMIATASVVVALLAPILVAASAQGFGEPPPAASNELPRGLAEASAQAGGPRRRSTERSRAEAAAGHAQAPGATTQARALPRTPDGKPDLSGFWQVMNTAAWDIQDHSAQKGVPAGQGVVEGNEIPYQPWAAAKKQENFANRLTADPETKCYLPGVPRITYMPFPFQIVPDPDQITILYEYVHAVRNIFMDGTPHPAGHIDWWMGDSRGRWEGDTLVVDLIHFNDQTWFDRAGNFHSDELHVVERYTLIDPDHITYEVTIEDPNVFTRPWKMSMPLYRRLEKNFQLLEYECYAFENEFHVSPPGRKGL